MYYEIYKLDPAKFLPSSGLAWQEALKETKVKLDLLTDIDMLLMVEKGVRGEIWFANFTWKNEDWKSRKACS